MPWIDNADSWVCPSCGFECSNPNKLPEGPDHCPRCGLYLGQRVVPGLRPCLVNGEKHLFHRWIERRWMVEASPLIDGHPAGLCASVLALVENKSGEVHGVHPGDVRFLDNVMGEYEKGGFFNDDCSSGETGEGT